MSNRFYGIALSCIMAAGGYLYTQADRAINYTTIPARVVSLKDKCQLVRKEGAMTHRIFTEDMSCDVDFASLQEDHAGRGFELTRQTELSLTYMSPVDGLQHTAAYTLDDDSHDYATDEVVEARVSKTSAEEVIGVAKAKAQEAGS